MSFDAIVIGSGFGGAVTACRLAEAGYRVLILERGRRWNKNNYPRQANDPWLWVQECPEFQNGWLDLRAFTRIAVAQGAGVGGGSLIYANISCEAPRQAFTSGWPQEITYEELKPHYDTVGQIMNVQRVPEHQWPLRMKLMKEAAEKSGHGDRFKPLELAVSFDSEWSYDLDDPHATRHSKEFVNEHGVVQGTCVHVGECDIGCPVHAKNTLDMNYIPRAERKGAIVRPLHFVTNIEPIRGGYRVHFDRLEAGRRVPGSETGRVVVVAAGSLGSTELLLRCRDETGSLPKLSQFLGRNWSSNGDFLTPAFYADRKLDPTRGPTITSAIDFLDRSQDGESFWIEDGGLFSLLHSCFARLEASLADGIPAQGLIKTINYFMRMQGPLANMMPWFAQGVDQPGGVMTLRPRWLWFGPRQLDLSWDVSAAKPVVDAIVRWHRRLSELTGGRPCVPPSWTQAGYLITPHPLGGCNMGDAATLGVVDHRGEVFEYRNLFVSDAAVIPRAIGVNPSRTIAAIAERNARIMIEEKR